MGLIAHSQQNALSELYDRYARLVYSIALNGLGDSARAEEITQDVFVRVWEKAYTYQSEQSKVTTWLSSIVRHRVIDDLRRRKARPEMNQDPWSLVESSEIAAPGNLELEVDHSLKRQRLRLALGLLPEDQRQALAYAFFLGYTHSEIAEALEEPLGTVKTRIRLGMQKLRLALAEEEVSDG